MLAAVSFGALGFLVVGLALGGPVGQLARGGLEAIPLVALAMLAQLGKERLWARLLTWGWTAFLTLSVVMITVLMTVQLSPGGGKLYTPAAQATLGLTSVLVLLCLAAGVVTLTPGGRRRLGRALPLDPTQLTSKVALSLVTFVSLAFLVPLVVLGDPPLLKMVGQMKAGAPSQQELLAQTFYPLLWLVPGTFLAVGLGINRTAGQAAERLGLRGTRAHFVATGLLCGLFLVAAIHFISPPLDELWSAAGLPATDQIAVEKLFARFMTPLGVVALSVSAGVGEELAFRGVLQPRLGIFLTNLLFTTLHAWQYNVDGLVLIFCVGAVMGLLRKHHNTVTAVLAHASYDFGLCVLLLHGVK